MRLRHMKSKEYCEMIAQLGLKAPGAADVLGLGLRQVQRFASGDSPVPQPVARLLRLMVKRNIKPAELIALGR